MHHEEWVLIQISLPLHICLALLLISVSLNSCSAFSPQTRVGLKSAVESCLDLSPQGKCFNGPHSTIRQWDVSRVTDMRRMFARAKLFNSDLSQWDVSSAKDMGHMFLDARSFNGDLSKWDVSTVHNMANMFQSAVSFNGDISNWDVSRVKDMYAMFLDATNFNQELCGAAWVHSTARKAVMFEGTSASISFTVCTIRHRRRNSFIDSVFSPRTRSQLVNGVSSFLGLSSTEQDGCASEGFNRVLDRVFPFQRFKKFDLGPPIFDVCPPDECVFHSKWTAAPLIERINVSKDTMLLTFGLPDKEAPLGLSTCAHISASNGAFHRVIRSYTPISTNNMLGQFQLWIKVYDKSMGGGTMSRYLNSVTIGETVEFKHTKFNVKIQYPFGVKHVGMLAGGTGITPMIQALHAILGNDEDHTKVTLLWSNRQSEDKEALASLEDWANDYADQFKLLHTLTREPEDSSWTGLRTRINKNVIGWTMPQPSEDCKILICGPVQMNKDLIGYLQELGYNDNQIVKM